MFLFYHISFKAGVKSQFSLGFEDLKNFTTYNTLIIFLQCFIAYSRAISVPLSWVVERKKSGVGYGKNARPKQEEVLVGKNKWISKQDWKNAIMARKKGTLTQQQKEWLDNGHWKDNR